MGGRQAVRPRTLDPVSKVRILPAQPVLTWRILPKFDWVANGAVQDRTALVVFAKLTGEVRASRKGLIHWGRRMPILNKL